MKRGNSKDILVIRLGGMADCFQPSERIYKVTYATIKALNEYRISYLIVTKRAMIADDEYVQILDKITTESCNNFLQNKVF
ncbi:MAG: hypothetical protein IJE60_09030 [Tyzzerella sp.]|nr:hypothetical protein [Tyzzerella sp.]